MKSITVYTKSNDSAAPIKSTEVHNHLISITFNAGNLLIHNDLGFFQYKMDEIYSFIVE